VFRTPAGERAQWTHVLLENHPDGGIARLRCFDGKAPDATDPGPERVKRVRHAAPIPRGGDTAHVGPDAAAIAAAWAKVKVGDVVNLASEALGAKVVATSNNRYGHSQQLLSDAAPKSMGDGWETSRSRGSEHHDFVVVALGREGTLERLTADFTYFVLNNPVALRVLGARSSSVDVLPGDDAWVELVLHTRVKQLAGAKLEVGTLAHAGPFTHVKLMTFPDGGANRLQVFGRTS
jgi:hypothetical protein